MQEGTFSVDGLRFRYLEWGDASAEPIVLVHGFSSTAAGWARVGEALASDYHVV
ncbi:MAG: alpha/beta hydrolase, partial [Chloroflexi bacterium]|nr:alpha/beta hydrolase [Chloroflexota bacterium]